VAFVDGAVQVGFFFGGGEAVLKEVNGVGYGGKSFGAVGGGYSHDQIDIPDIQFTNTVVDNHFVHRVLTLNFLRNAFQPGDGFAFVVGVLNGENSFAA